MLRQSALKGFNIPGAAERLVTALFADDTSAFLSKRDSWTGLWTILNTWCRASRAHFNDEKTEVIPVGTPAYRRRVLETRRLEPDDARDEMIPPNVHIAADGTPTRILGAWIGNEIEEMAIWTPTLEKVQLFLNRWKRCRPTMLGKRHIVQMGPGGITQFLASVQDMPPRAEKQLKKMIREFIWDSPTPPPVNMDTLCLPLAEGGINLLDIEARNQAIQVMWLKRYLDLGPKRPTGEGKRMPASGCVPICSTPHNEPD
ncbi:hypothetical protein FOMPIDRAFT_1137242 [Fomitopsis schrenkii]|uniref:Reverse transcriptase domain-containing protein n=1 Tax=Fomitopsis schrenkii TaxID=2126942 RepID=S8ESY1_FOMSC|nr:hypothetical protein FOMPIDRAFT_1137242 [Fomitopsis schrenkii]